MNFERTQHEELDELLERTFMHASLSEEARHRHCALFCDRACCHGSTTRWESVITYGLIMLLLIIVTIALYSFMY